MLRQMVAKCVKWALKEKAPLIEQQPPSELLYNLRSGSPVFTVWPISNGYLIVGSDERTIGGGTFYYIKDLSELSDSIVTMKARIAIGVPDHVRFNSWSSVTGKNTNLSDANPF